ncbi:unnamed protein product, partial [Amoebophrya sp. A25]
TFELPVCKHYLQDGGRCAFGAQCAFSHDVALPVSEHDNDFGKLQQQSRRAWGGRRRHVSNDFRASTFRLWALEKFKKQLTATTAD